MALRVRCRQPGRIYPSRAFTPHCSIASRFAFRSPGSCSGVHLNSFALILRTEALPLKRGLALLLRVLAANMYQQHTEFAANILDTLHMMRDEVQFVPLGKLLAEGTPHIKRDDVQFVALRRMRAERSPQGRICRVAHLVRCCSEVYSMAWYWPEYVNSARASSTSEAAVAVLAPL